MMMESKIATALFAKVSMFGFVLQNTPPREYGTYIHDIHDIHGSKAKAARPSLLLLLAAELRC